VLRIFILNYSILTSILLQAAFFQECL